MKISTRFGLGMLCASVFLAAEAFGQSTYTTPEAQKAAAQLSQPAGPPPQVQNNATNIQSDRTTVPGYGSSSSAAPDNRPVQPIYENSAAMGARPMPMRDIQTENSAMAGPHDNGTASSVNAQQRGEIGVWLVENGGQGVRVARLARGGAADRAGLKSGDIITQVNGNNVESPRTAAQEIREIPVGQQANLTVMRDGAQQQLQVTLAAARPGQSYQVGYGGDTENSGDRNMMSADRGNGGLAARTERLEQQMASMTQELREMREQMMAMRASSDSRRESSASPPSASTSGTTPSTASPTSSSATPPQAGTGSTTPSSSTTPTPASGTSSTNATTPSSSSGSSGTSDQDLFGTGSSSSGTSSASGTTK